MFQSFFEDQSKIKLPKSNNKLYDNDSFNKLLGIVIT